MQDGLPAIDPDPQTALAEAYTGAHRKRFPAPVLPPEYEQADLGTLAVASPYAGYVQRGDDGRFRWDLRALEPYQLHAGLVPVGPRWTAAPAPCALPPSIASWAAAVPATPTGTGPSAWPCARPPTISRSSATTTGSTRPPAPRSPWPPATPCPPTIP